MRLWIMCTHRVSGTLWAVIGDRWKLIMYFRGLSENARDLYAILRFCVLVISDASTYDL